MKIIHEYDDAGNHRLAMEGGPKGKWVGHHDVAELNDLRAVTEYYGEDIFGPDRVVSIESVEAETRIVDGIRPDQEYKPMMTPNFSVLVKRGDSESWVEVKDVQDGDLVATEKGWTPVSLFKESITLVGC